MTAWEMQSSGWCVFVIAIAIVIAIVVVVVMGEEEGGVENILRTR